MWRNLISSLPILLLLVAACKSPENETGNSYHNAPVFPKGELRSENFTGKAWVQMMVSNDSTHNVSIGSVTFEPGARTFWHLHPGGQILLITAGLGYYQEKGSPVKLVHKGDIVKCPPNLDHWHGASPDSAVTHIAISTNLQDGAVVWKQAVTKEEYESFK